MADAPQPTKKQVKADKAAEKARAKAERPLWKKPWVWVIGIIALIVVASVAGGGGDTGTTTGDTAQEDSVDDGDAAETTGVGQPAEDGNFTFTVTSFECGETTIGKNQFTRTKAQGEFCIAEMTVENHGDEAQLMDGSSQYLYIGTRNTPPTRMRSSPTLEPRRSSSKRSTRASLLTASWCGTSLLERHRIG